MISSLQIVFLRSALTRSRYIPGLSRRLASATIAWKGCVSRLALEVSVTCSSLTQTTSWLFTHTIPYLALEVVVTITVLISRVILVHVDVLGDLPHL